MQARKALLALAVLSLLAFGSTAYIAFAAEPGPVPPGPRDPELLTDNIRFDGAVLVGAHKGDMAAVIYALVAYGPRHTTVLAYLFAFVGVAEVRNETVIASAKASNTTWANTDFRTIERDGRPIGLAMGFRNEGPIYIEYTSEDYGQSGYYNVSITVVLTAFYHPRLKETVLARLGGGGNSSLVAYDVHGGVVLAAAFKIEGWPEGPEDTRLVVGFWVVLRAFSWIETRAGRTRAQVIGVSPFCGSTRPRLERESGLIRGTFAFVNRAVIKEGDAGPEAVRAFCLYQVKGWLLKLGVIVPSADVVAYPAVKR